MMTELPRYVDIDKPIGVVRYGIAGQVVVYPQMRATIAPDKQHGCPLRPIHWVDNAVVHEQVDPTAVSWLIQICIQPACCTSPYPISTTTLEAAPVLEPAVRNGENRA